MATQNIGTPVPGRRGRIASTVLLVLLAASAGRAQSALTGFELQTGLLSFFSRGQNAAVVTVTEVGDRTAQSTVRIVFYNAADQVLLTKEGRLERGRPVRAELPLDGDRPLVQVRASIAVFGVTDRGSSPVVVLEDIDRGSFTIGQRVSCAAPPGGRSGPVLPLCPEVVVNSITM